MDLSILTELLVLKKIFHKNGIITTLGSTEMNCKLLLIHAMMINAANKCSLGVFY